jgi:RNA polymerase sigma-70 factor (ECF subfamily)
MSGLIENERFRKLLLSFPAKAIEFLYDQYYRSLIRIAKNLTHDPKVSEDIVQDTFVHIWENHKHLGQYHDRSFEYYLVRVVKNKAITYYKQSKQLQEQKIQFLNGHDLNENDLPVEAKLIRGEMSQEIRQLIHTFPKREKECLLMKMDDEMNTAQIAAYLNVSKKAVERSLTSANKRLRKYWLSKK